MYNGIIKKVIKYLGFLTTNYDMKFLFQSFGEFKGFYGPSDCYSFYNENGCFTLHDLVQRGEWGGFISERISNVQDVLLDKEINLSQIMNSSYFFTSSWLKALGNLL